MSGLADDLLARKVPGAPHSKLCPCGEPGTVGFQVRIYARGAASMNLKSWAHLMCDSCTRAKWEAVTGEKL